MHIKSNVILLAFLGISLFAADADNQIESTAKSFLSESKFSHAEFNVLALYCQAAGAAASAEINFAQAYAEAMQTLLKFKNTEDKAQQITKELVDRTAVLNTSATYNQKSKSALQKVEQYIEAQSEFHELFDILGNHLYSLNLDILQKNESVTHDALDQACLILVGSTIPSLGQLSKNVVSSDHDDAITKVGIFERVSQALHSDLQKVTNAENAIKQPLLIMLQTSASFFQVCNDLLLEKYPDYAPGFNQFATEFFN